jgi:hypothetical protein
MPSALQLSFATAVVGWLDTQSLSVIALCMLCRLIPVGDAEGYLTAEQAVRAWQVSCSAASMIVAVQQCVHQL